MKKLVCLALLTSAACIVTATYSASPASDDSTSIFRGNLEHTGVYAGSAPSQLNLKWKFHTDGPVLSSPVVSNGILFIGSSDNNLYALDSATGALKWKFKTESRLTSSPAVAENTVYFLSYDSNFYAVAADTGTLKWKFKTAGEHRYTARHLHGAAPDAELMPDPFDFYLSSAAIWNGAVYFGSGDGNVYALDARSGAPKWKFHTNDVVHASPAISGGTLFIGSWDSYMYALDASSGKERWRFKTGEDPDIHNQQGIQASAAVADKTVYFGCRDSNFYAVDAVTGKQKWSFNNKGSWVIGSAALQDGKVYFATSDSGLFHALDGKTGAEIFSLDFKKWPMFSSPAIAGNNLYIGSHIGKLYAIDLQSHQLSAFETDGFKQAASTYIKPDGTANYDAAFPDFFYDGVIVGVYKMFALGSVISSPAIDHQTIFFGSTDGNVYALN
jgi:outer membrane protein assembly factor BamB